MKAAQAVFSEPAEVDEVDLRRQVAFLFSGVRELQGGSVAPGAGRPGLRWASWLGEVYRDRVRHSMRAVYVAAEERQMDEIFREDLELSGWEGWPPGSREGSLLLGRSLLEARADLRGERMGRRLQQGIASGMAEGHAPVVFAVHAVTYGIPLWVSLVGYVFLEWRLALGAPETSGGTLDRFLDEGEHQGLLADTQRFLQGHGPGLRVV
ncbi:MAG TPA: urease accessory UreF family protein [Verrucomicrobiales bacterium]|nr:urease accessory UreF family protein [Verrucomicrobiales bacterium]